MSHIMNMELKMIHLSMSNNIINELNSTLVITVNNGKGMNKKPKLIKKMTDPNFLCSCIECTMILRLCNQKGDYLLFLT